MEKFQRLFFESENAVEAEDWKSALLAKQKMALVIRAEAAKTGDPVSSFFLQKFMSRCDGEVTFASKVFMGTEDIGGHVENAVYVCDFCVEGINSSKQDQVSRETATAAQYPTDSSGSQCTRNSRECGG